MDIKDAFSDKIIISGKYGSIREACEDNRANLNGAQLNGAKLNGAQLNDAQLNGAQLNGADWDLAAFPLWCGTLDIHVCERLPRQLIYHISRMHIKTKDKDLVKLVNSPLWKKVANKFHRVDQCGKIQ